MKKTIISMSGGVDFSTAAYLMKKQGYDCIGITMKLFNNEDICISRQHSCCSLDDIEDERRVADGTYADFIELYTRKIYHGGDFIDLNCNVIGTHNGIIRYTIGQRKGLGVSAPNPLYVCEIDSENNTVKLGSYADLFINKVTAGQINLISVQFLEGNRRLKVKICYRHPEQWATVL